MPQSGVLRGSGPFSLPRTLLCGQAFRWRPVPRCPGRYVGVAGGAAWALEDLGSAVRWACGSPRVRDEAPGTWLSRYLRLDESHDGLPQAWGARPGDLLDRAYGEVKGLRLLRQEPFECTVSYMFAQGLSVTVISQAVEKLCRAFGAPLEPPLGHARERFHDFPTAPTLAALTPRRIRPFVNNYLARGERILRLASVVDSGALDLERLRSVPLDEAREALMALDGVGPKIADCILLFSLEQPSAFPLDRWVVRALQEHGGFRRELRGFRGALTLPRYLSLVRAARQKFGERCGLAGEALFLHLRMREDAGLRRNMGGEVSR